MLTEIISSARETYFLLSFLSCFWLYNALNTKVTDNNSNIWLVLCNFEAATLLLLWVGIKEIRWLDSYATGKKSSVPQTAHSCTGREEAVCPTTRKGHLWQKKAQLFQDWCIYLPIYQRKIHLHCTMPPNSLGTRGSTDLCRTLTLLLTSNAQLLD